MSYEKTFEDAFKAVIEEEGGYTIDPLDPGGETKYGISKRAYPNLVISALTLDDAKEIYYRDYWSPIYGSTLPRAAAIVMFDSAVNQGVRAAVKFAQRTVAVTADGIMGLETRKAIEGQDAEAFAREFTAQRILHYAGLPTFARFGRGWIRRALRAMERALE